METEIPKQTQPYCMFETGIRTFTTKPFPGVQVIVRILTEFYDTKKRFSQVKSLTKKLVSINFQHKLPFRINRSFANCELRIC